MFGQEPLGNPRFALGSDDVVVVTGAPDRGSLRRIGRARRPKIVVNRELGFTGRDLDFLVDVGAGVEALEVVGTFDDDSGLLACAGLRELNLNTDRTSQLDLSALPRLEYLFTYAARLDDSLGRMRHLRDVHLYGADDDDVALLAGLPSVSRLTLSSARVRHTEWGLDPLSLCEIDIRLAPRLADFSGLASLTRLQGLSLDACRRLDGLDVVTALPRLRTLSFSDDGDVATLEPLRAAMALTRLLFTGTTNIVDGDLSPLADLPALAEAVYRRRRHYSGAPAGFPSA